MVTRIFFGRPWLCDAVVLLAVTVRKGCTKESLSLFNIAIVGPGMSFYLCHMPFFTDQLNRTIELASPPGRIISLVPSQTELLYDLGLDKEVAGITRFCMHPENGFAKKPGSVVPRTFIRRKSGC